MKNIKIGGFTLGIDMKSDETSLPKGTVRDAVNVDLTTGGGIKRREGATMLAGFTGAHSLWSPRSGIYGLFAQYDALRMLTFPGVAPSVRTVASGLSLSERMTYCEDGTDTIFSNGVDLGIVPPTGMARAIGVSDPLGAPHVAARESGGMLPGTYGCAYSFVSESGEESGLSPAMFLTLPAGGSIDFAIPPTPIDVTLVRLYTTPVNGDVFYQMAEVPAGLALLNVSDDTPGKIAANQHLHRMPGGQLVRIFHGRLLVARGDTLIFSEPFNFGLTSRRHNFVQFQDDITMVEPVEGGVYVGTSAAVYFLAGAGPGDFVQQVASLNAPALGASTLVPAAALPDNLESLGDAPCALWLGRLGYSVGMSNGIVHDVQSSRIDLPEYDAGSMVTYTKNGLVQVVSVVQSEQSNGAGSAIDSPL